MSFYLQAGPNEARQIIARGDLLHVAQGLDEYKFYWNGETDFDFPTVSFAHEGGTVLLELKRTTANGWAGHTFKDGFQFGANLNRVRRSNRRWGLTVWRRSQKTAAKEVRRVTEHDLSGLLEALR